MHSLDDFRGNGLQDGDALTSYLVSGLEVRIALMLYALALAHPSYPQDS